MGRPLLVCAPLVSAALVGCLLHPGGRATPGDGGADGRLSHDGPADGIHGDGTPATICAGAGAPVDPLTSGMCGSGTASGSGGTLAAQGGMLTATVNEGNASCAWNISNNASSFHGVVVRVASAPDTMGDATLSFSDSNGVYSMGFQSGSTVQVTGGSWSPEQSPVTLSAPFCARIHVVLVSGSGASMLEGQVDTGNGWRTVAAGSWSPLQTGQVKLGAYGMSATATFDRFDYVAPDQ